MANFDHREKKLEEAIEYYLTTEGGYVWGNANSFDKQLALNTNTLFAFIKTTQAKEWTRYQAIYGSASEKAFIDRFCKEVRQVGIIHVLRQGITDRAIKFRLAYFKPETELNEQTLKLYDQNILSCTRQLYYSSRNNNSLDMVLFLNGIPIVTMELKDQFSGQDVSDAINQYKYDRSPTEAIFDFPNRTLVHFAVDLKEIYMTTRLESGNTNFLPFNQGLGGAGNVGGAGNPVKDDNFAVSYLWENVLYKDSLMEILQKFVHLEKKTKKDKTGKKTETKSIIFPRYHQLDVVRKLLNDVKRTGSGKNYLIQHSAGSGKSNSIAWLAHRLSGLHNESNDKIFKSVIVVTDRKVLDNQLQDTIFQFDHKLGVVEKIDKNSAQLKDAINSGKAIIITTLQKFPVIYKEIIGGNNNFAIIVDEAHSSQTGEAAKKLKKALADTESILEEYARMENMEEAERKDDEDKMLDELAAQGQHKNLSFFAFTATPKDKTLQMFGEKQQDGKFKAYHIYSMQQAIEEGFILDVLKNYTTYNHYFEIIKQVEDDPELDSARGATAIRRFESLHPHNLAQKTVIIIEHFRSITKNKIGGNAKAMVVTSSRLHAVRYLLEFRRYIKEKRYDDLDVLVAFSGAVNDDGAEYTEEKLNKTSDGKTIKEKQLPEQFSSVDFNMLIVAEKYQTGFDEPLLHTMFVDKVLSGVKAVQTLSRLNRTIPGKKEDTFVLDFVNTADDIRKSFEPFYQATILSEEASPNIIYDLRNTLDEYHLWQQSEIDIFAKIYYKSADQEMPDLGKLAASLQPALDRLAAKDSKEQDDIKTGLGRFVRLYAFITQVCRMFDKEMHKFSVYVKFLLKLIPKGKIDKILVDDKVLLDKYKLEKDFEGNITINENPEICSAKGNIGGKDKKKEPLSVIIEKINERFGTSFSEMDKILAQLTQDFMADERLVDLAKNNPQSTFERIFEQQFKDIAALRYEQNEEFFVRMFKDEEFMCEVIKLLFPEVYRKLRKK
ncbi:MAG: type I restriction endonuclease [Ignavibacteria bacterium]|nr:type I restriction endonuclease [Ignavibacteria bacterium]